MESKQLTPLFFDLETQRSFDEVNYEFSELGVSVAVVREAKKDTVYYEDDVPALIERLKAADLIVGHNHIRFDYTVLRGYGLDNELYNYLANKSYDTFAHLQEITGERISLDHLSKNNLEGGPGKLAPGAKCIEWYKSGKIEKIVELCSDDVHRLARIFGLIVLGRPLRIKQYWLEGEDKFKEALVTLPKPSLTVPGNPKEE